MQFSNGPTWFLVPQRGGGNEHTPPPKARRPVQTEQSVAVGFLVELPLHELLVEGPQLGQVGLSAHGWTAVLVPVLRPNGHGEVHGGQQAQHAGDDQRGGVTVVHHCSPTQTRVSGD